MKTIDVDQKTVRVLIVDDQKSVRHTLKLYLESNSQIEVVGLAEDGVAALEKIAELTPDIAIIDLEMPGMNGITTIEIINERFPLTKTLVLSSHDQKEYIHQSIVAGANGYLMKGASEEKLTTAVLKMNQGYFQLDTKLSEKIALNTKVNFEEEYLAVDIDEIDLLPMAGNKQENSAEASNEDLTAMRREIVDILEFKIHLLESKKNTINLSFQKLQRRFAWLLASQLVLFFMVLGSTSSMLKMRQQTKNNIQSSNFVNIAQLVELPQYHR
ncbi:response regulator containing a CheY-like receiver domain and an HTH DNA-binding domain [Xenococcus sp. PCC 7305]|uniref:response regulator n=1 Tax=Xenococcus sp. PCC 7305 TaxID=102125 RepID=UPI0002ABC631|nr:response regulator transcription factor [Xenococcus sp. PCC 7305]ELS02238.1 response regulator containing a CheY-like receiver domain and an HTH DNA-binding domain [Xenococcus sp. PCC 7305]